MSYNLQAMRLKAFFIMFLLLSFVTAPVIDAVACDDCADPVPAYQRAGDNLQALQDLAGEAGHGENHGAPPRGTAKDLCPLCANAVVGIASVKGGSPFETTHRVIQPKLLVLADPSYPITKPPQN
jgi:hypothetical protein